MFFLSPAHVRSSCFTGGGFAAASHLPTEKTRCHGAGCGGCGLFILVSVSFKHRPIRWTLTDFNICTVNVLRRWLFLADVQTDTDASLNWFCRIVWVYLSVGIWVYPLLGHFSSAGLLFFFLFNMSVVTSLYMLGNKMNTVLWSKRGSVWSRETTVNINTRFNPQTGFCTQRQETIYEYYVIILLFVLLF